MGPGNHRLHVDQLGINECARMKAALSFKARKLGEILMREH